MEQISRSIAAEQFWRDGWNEARQTLKYGSEDLPPDNLSRLTALVEFLKPKNLVDKVRGVIGSAAGGALELDELEDFDDGNPSGSIERAATIVEKLGRDLAADVVAFKSVLPLLINGSELIVALGQGLASASEAPRDIWNTMTAQVAAATDPNVGLLCGFLAGVSKRDAAIANALLDEALEDSTLAVWFPTLQCSVILDEMGLARFHRALELGRAPVRHFTSLVYGGFCAAVAGPELKRLLLAIGRRPGGVSVAMDILSMRMETDRREKRDPVKELVEAGRELITLYEFGSKGSQATREDYQLRIIVLISLPDAAGRPVARRLCRALMAAAARRDVSVHEHDDIMRALFQVHPEDILDELFSGEKAALANSIRLLNAFERFRKTPMDAIPDDIVIGWCDRYPEIRYPLMAAVAPMLKKPTDQVPNEWTNLIQRLLLAAPDPEPVFIEILNRLRPMSWSGSRSTILESNLKLLDHIDIGATPALKAIMDKAKDNLRREIESQRRSETAEDIARSGRFE